MGTNNLRRRLEVLPEESRLVQQAKSGDADAFVQLYDAYVERVYRYIFFRVINDLAAEDITLHVFRNAWEHLAGYRKFSSSFIAWLYKIAKNLVIDYYKTDIKNHSFNVRILEPMARSVEDLNLGREPRPSTSFNTHTRSWLTQYLKFHTRRPRRTSLSLQSSLSIAGMIAMLLVTGTAQAQTALPGDPFYGWKRTSEQAWRTLSPDPVGTDIALANRRLHEWIAVENDPARSANAMHDYYEVLTKLKPAGDAKARARILPMLTAQKQALNNAGLSSIQLNELLVAAANPGSILTSAVDSLTEITQTTTAVPTKIGSQAGDVPPQNIPTEASPLPPQPPPPPPPPTDIPTQAPPPTDVPTQAPPPTDVPTQAPLPTDVPTQAPPPTDVPTQAPPPTDAPTQAPPPTDAPTQAPPPADAPTQAPPPTDVPVPVPQPPTTGPSLNAAPPVTDVSNQIAAPAADSPVAPADNPTTAASGGNP
jgi:DNA-directed RNA polymerase specialized sigma24 family protein